MDIQTFFRTFTEDWTTKYRPMHHDPSPTAHNKRFFLCDGMAGMGDMLRTIDPDLTPCLQMESAVEGNVRDGNEYRYFTLWFCVRADDPGDGHEAARTKEEALTHLKAFVAYLNHMRKQVFMQYGYVLDIADYNFSSYGPLWDGWNAVKLEVTVGEKVNTCYEDMLNID